MQSGFTTKTILLCRLGEADRVPFTNLGTFLEEKLNAALEKDKLKVVVTENTAVDDVCLVLCLKTSVNTRLSDGGELGKLVSACENRLAASGFLFPIVHSTKETSKCKQLSVKIDCPEGELPRKTFVLAITPFPPGVSDLLSIDGHDILTMKSSGNMQTIYSNDKYKSTDVSTDRTIKILHDELKREVVRNLPAAH